MRKIYRFIPILRVLIVIGLLFLGYLALRIRHVECVVKDGECTTRQRDILSNYKARFALGVNRQELIDELKKDPRVKDVEIRFELGTRMRVTIEYSERFLSLRVVGMVIQEKTATGSALLWSQVDEMLGYDVSTGESFFLWEGGYLTQETKRDLYDAVVFADKMPEAGELRILYTRIGDIKEKYPDKAVFVRDTDILMKLSDKVLVLFDMRKDPALIFEALQQIQAVTTIEEGVRLIDLRFNKPVISEKQ